MDSFKIALAGCGRVAEYHVLHLKRTPSALLCAVIDEDAAKAKAFAAKHGVPHSFSSLSEAFAQLPLDAVHVATPPASHETLAHLSLEAGAHVLIEKPLAFSLSATQAVLDLARQKRLLATPDFIHLFTPVMDLAREWIRAGHIGRVLGVNCSYFVALEPAVFAETARPHWSFELPGGVLHNYITHPLYLVLSLTGPAREIRTVPRSGGCLPQGLTDHLDIFIEGNRCCGSISLSLLARPFQNTLTIAGEKASIVVDLQSFLVNLVSAHGLPSSAARIAAPLIRSGSVVRQTIGTITNVARKKLLPYSGLHRLFTAFYHAAGGHGENPVPMDLTLDVARAEEQIFAGPGKWCLEKVNGWVTGRPAVRGDKPVVALTGASGYLGSRVVQLLREAGWHVRALVRFQSRIEHLENQGVELYFGDLRNPGGLFELFRDVVATIHMGAGMRGSRRFVVDSCVEGARNVISAVAAENVPRNIFVSSFSVFDFLGIASRGVLQESSPLEPHPEERSAYAEGKILAERLAHEANATDPRWLILRPATIFGGGKSPAELLGINKGGRIICFGGPAKQVRLIHVDDVARAIMHFLDDRYFKAGLTVNLAHPDVITNAEIVELTCQRKPITALYVSRPIGRMAGVGTRLAHRILRHGPVYSKRQVAYLFSNCSTNVNLSRDLGWRPSAPLRDQIIASV